MLACERQQDLLTLISLILLQEEPLVCPIILFRKFIVLTAGPTGRLTHFSLRRESAATATWITPAACTMKMAISSPPAAALEIRSAVWLSAANIREKDL